jgi:hypothetical protein
MRLACLALTALSAVLAPVGLGAQEPRESAERRSDARPRVSLRLGMADASGVPGKEHHGKTGGGNFIVRQPSPDTLQITMTGLAQAHGNPLSTSAAHFHFDLRQSFTVVFNDPAVGAASLHVQGYVMGVLRSPCKGTAALAKACAALAVDGVGPELCLPARSVGAKDNLSLYLRTERLCVPAVPACYVLHQAFEIVASEPKGSVPGHGASVDFSTSEDQTVNFGTRHDPFDGVSRRDFGFHVIVRVVPLDRPEDAAALPTPRAGEDR